MRRELLSLLIILNFFGFLFGLLFFYGNQLLRTNPLLWVFTPDCPFAALFSMIALILVLYKWKSNALFFLSFTSGVKYGVWTIFVTLTYWSFYAGSGLFINVVNVAAHVLLIVQQFLLLKHLRVDLKWFSLITGFLIANDLSDYLLGTHPPLPGSAVNFMFAFTVSLTLMSALIVYYLVKRRVIS